MHSPGRSLILRRALASCDGDVCRVDAGTIDAASAQPRSALDCFTVLLSLFALLLLLGSPFAAAKEFLEPEKAFRFSASMVDPDTAEVRYQIARGYYMYRERFTFQSPDAKLGSPLLPKGKVKYDETFQKDVEAYRGEVRIRIPVQAGGRFTLIATSQGCADEGLCYSPMDSSATLDVAAAIAAGTGASSSSAVAAGPAAGASSSMASDGSTLTAMLESGNLLRIVPLFMLLGLGLAFTPCVLPMVPILSSIIVGGRGTATRGRMLLLASAYSLGMAVVYTALGVAAGLAGEGLAASLQNVWVLGAFALVMVALSLAMFGVYEMQMPAAIQSRLLRASNRRPGGKLVSVFVMGGLSGLIVGPCVAAPLAGVLLYISHTRDAWVGGTALFSIAAGMSVPLLLVGVSAGALLPRAGPWMDIVKRLFGVLMLATALWLVGPVLPSQLNLLGWAALGLGTAAWLFQHKTNRMLARTLAVLFLALGLVQSIGLVTGANDPLAPLAAVGHAEEETSLAFESIGSVAELDQRIASSGGKTVMLDFYADWCVSCKEMEKFTFSDPGVQAGLSDMVRLRADVTANNADDRALLKRFALFGPPGIIFFGADGNEIRAGRVIGYQDAADFLISLDRVRGM